MSLVKDICNDLPTLGFDSSRLKYLKRELPRLQIIMTAANIAQILQPFGFDSGKQSALKLLEPFLRELDTNGACGILGQFGFDSGKLGALKILQPWLASITIRDRQKILNLFGFDSGKMHAIKILGGKAVNQEDDESSDSSDSPVSESSSSSSSSDDNENSESVQVIQMPGFTITQRGTRNFFGNVFGSAVDLSAAPAAVPKVPELDPTKKTWKTATAPSVCLER